MDSSDINNQSKFPKNVKLISTERFSQGGNSSKNFENFNLAFHVDDNPENVLANRSILRDHYDLPSEPVWINQTHSSICINASLNDSLVEADASFSSKPGIVCAILTADCLPVFIFKKDGTMVGIAHAVWRGLISGVIESLIQSLDCDGKNLHAHLGPAISINAFEVGEEIKTLYLSRNNNFSRSFSSNSHYSSSSAARASGNG